MDLRNDSDVYIIFTVITHKSDDGPFIINSNT